MPGYRLLSTTVNGAIADQAREAERLQAGGDMSAAIGMLEAALADACARAPELPGWLCGRLAALYRRSGQYDDEVSLLRRYRDSQDSDEARTRFDARLSKAQAIADRRRTRTGGALQSVREVRERPRPRSRRKLPPRPPVN